VIARGRDLRAYLERDILAGLDPFPAQTMLTTALLPRVIFPRDETFLPGLPGQAEAVLEEFVSRGFLVTRTGRRSYTIHPLVRGFCRTGGVAERQRDRAGSAGRPSTWSAPASTAMLLLSICGPVNLDDAARLLRSLALSTLNAAVNFTRDDWLDLIPEGVSPDNLRSPG